MIDFSEAYLLHEALQYDGVVIPRATLQSDFLQSLPDLLAESFQILTPHTPLLIVMPWRTTQAFQALWEQEPRIKSVRPATSWLWGYSTTFAGVDVFASGIVGCILVSGVRDLRTIFDHGDKVVRILV